MKKKIFTSKEVLNMTNLKPYQLDYIVRVGDVSVMRNGKSNPRLFSVEAINQIMLILDRRGNTPIKQ